MEPVKVISVLNVVINQLEPFTKKEGEAKLVVVYVCGMLTALGKTLEEPQKEGKQERIVVA